MSMVVLGIAGTAVAAGGAVYSGVQQRKAAKQQANAIREGTQEFDPVLLGDPNQVDTRAVGLRTIDEAYDNLPYARRLTDQLNAINYATAAKYYRKMQPEFFNIQRQLGINALSAMRGELPDDVSAQIGQRAAERGIQGGFGFGTQGAKTGALANLNLRNLGLTSLDQQRYGNQLGMQANQSAKTLLPQQIGPMDLFLTPGQQLQSELFNVGAQNDFLKQNNQIQNNAGLQNTQLQNSMTQSLAALDYAGALAQSDAIAKGLSVLGSGISTAANRQAGSVAPGGIINNPTADPAWKQNVRSYTTPRLY